VLLASIMSSSSLNPVPPIPKPPSNLSKPTTSPGASGSNSDSDSEDEFQTFHDASTNFSPLDEAALLSESNATKSEANTLFSQQRYSEAISIYDRALASCPNYLDYEVAVLKSNISACHLLLEEWKAAVDSATEALDGLESLVPLPKEEKEKQTGNGAKTPRQQNGVKKAARGTQDDRDKPDVGGDVVEIPDSEDESTALHRLSLSDTRRKDISRIRLKSLLRRARARHRQATWASLAGAEEDYRLLLSLLTTPSSAHSQKSSQSDLATVKSALRTLPAEINSAKEKEMGEMMGKLKELGNGILKPFGLSTDNFKMVKDEKSGGYSMNFEGGGKK
jgi:tetratricopeptide (TPR) repeat protein